VTRLGSRVPRVHVDSETLRTDDAAAATPAAIRAVGR
jgi:hypothetical protein